MVYSKTYLTPVVFIFLLISVQIQVQSTKIGIGTSNPQEELDVQGDINLTGGILTNMQSGTAGQILQAQSSGNMKWVDLQQYSNFKTFLYSPNVQTWTIPVKATEIVVEAWGAGGSGGSYQGGGGGGYILAKFSPKQATINIKTAVSTVVNDTTRVQIGPNTFIDAYSGLNGRGGSAYSNCTYCSWIPYNGEDGELTKVEYHPYVGNDVVKMSYFGKGGNSPFRPLSGGDALYEKKFINANSTYYCGCQNGNNGQHPGGGGGGCSNSTPAQSYGGFGMVIIYW